MGSVFRRGRIPHDGSGETQMVRFNHMKPLAATINSGIPMAKVAKMEGITEQTLRQRLHSAGYARKWCYVGDLPDQEAVPKTRLVPIAMGGTADE
jgi:hypothetical protein